MVGKILAFKPNPAKQMACSYLLYTRREYSNCCILESVCC